LLGIGGSNGALVGRLGNEIELVSGKSDDDILVGLALELFDPRLRLIQRCLSYISTHRSWRLRFTYGLCDVVDDYGAVGVPVVHGRERLVALLACRVPDLELDGCVLIEGDGLSEEGGADGGFPVVVELVLQT
jgi:hypothetical protein